MYCNRTSHDWYPWYPSQHPSCKYLRHYHQRVLFGNPQVSSLYQGAHKQLAHVQVEKLVSEDRVRRYKAASDPLRAEAEAARAQASELEGVTLRQMERLKALSRDKQVMQVGGGWWVVGGGWWVVGGRFGGRR